MGVPPLRLAHHKGQETLLSILRAGERMGRPTGGCESPRLDMPRMHRPRFGAASGDQYRDNNTATYIIPTIHKFVIIVLQGDRPRTQPDRGVERRQRSATTSRATAASTGDQFRRRTPH